MQHRSRGARRNAASGRLWASPMHSELLSRAALPWDCRAALNASKCSEHRRSTQRERGRQSSPQHAYADHYHLDYGAVGDLSSEDPYRLGAELPAPVVEVTILNPWNSRKFLDDKLSIVDINACDQAGRVFEIEVRLLAEALLPDRSGYVHRYRICDDQGRSLIDQGGISVFELPKLAPEQVHTEDDRRLQLSIESERMRGRAETERERAGKSAGTGGDRAP